MRFFEMADDVDGVILGLESGQIAPGRTVIIHVHGYGGDHFSNSFVRSAHTYWPGRGIAFVSIQLPTSGYIEERYSDSGVRYVGSCLVPPEEAASTVVRVVAMLVDLGARVVLQGHSFGTNIVRHVSLMESEILGAVYLSPCDSRALQAEYLRRTDQSDLSERGIDWNRFGVAAEDRVYSIPIDSDILPEMLSSSIFGIWSDKNLWRPTLPSCVVVASADPLAHAGGLVDRLEQGQKQSDRLTVTKVTSDSHSFADNVRGVHRAVDAWHRSLTASSGIEAR